MRLPVAGLAEPGGWLPPIRAINIDANGERIDCGTDASLDDIYTGTAVAIVRINTLSTGSNTRRIMTKTSGNWSLVQVTGNDWQFAIGRATQSLLINVDGTGWTPSLVAGRWYFLAATFNTSGVDGDQKMYAGTESIAPREPGAYATQRVGSGTETSVAGGSFYLGNNPVDTSANELIGHLYFAGVLTKYLTLPEVHALWRDVWNPSLSYRWAGVCGARLWCYPGLNDTGPVRDWSGYGNHGTVVNGTSVLGPPMIPSPWIDTAYRAPAAPTGVPPSIFHSPIFRSPIFRSA